MNRVTVLSVASVATLLLILIYCSRPSDKHSSFMDVELDINNLMENERYREAITLLENVAHKFPGHDYEIQSYLGVLYAHTGDYEKCLDIWQAGLEEGYFFGIYPQREVFKPFEKYDRFKAIAEENERLRTAAIKDSKTRVKVVAPGKKGRGGYPLLIALHGGGSTMEWAQRYWRSKRLKKRFVVAYVQSYLYDGMKSYRWSRYDPRARLDIKELYEDIVSEYPVDTERVVIGGASAGGVMAIDISINAVIPTAGFIGVCPSKPQEFDRMRVRMARENGIKGVIIGGEQDFHLPRQKEMVEVFRAEYFPHEFVVIPGLGHEYPKDFSRRIDLAVDYILGTR